MGFVKKYLSSDGLHREVVNSLLKEHFAETNKSIISWQDCIMSGLAIFGLKFSSLLQFDKSKEEQIISMNLKNLYHVKKVPSDSCLRERLDTIEASKLRRPFRAIFTFLQRGKVLERYLYLDKYYILSVDGTGQYSSDKIHCKNCCEKHHRDGSITYYHHMLGGAIVHPDERVVIPIAPEAIVKSDGEDKNDSERNASKRLLKDFRREHPHLKTIVVEDGLASNYPHLSLLDDLNLKYIIGVKAGDHKFLFDWIKNAQATETVINQAGIRHVFRYVCDVPLNEEHKEYRVNVLEYWEENKNGKKKYFSWVTNFNLTTDNVFDIMRAGRARWKIENETFNTLKNNGYNFAHNYGHGENNLCSVMTMLMLLAFLIDQVQLLCCSLKKRLKEKYRTWYEVFEKTRVMIQMVVWESWLQFYEFLLNPKSRPPPNWYGEAFDINK